MRFGGGEQAGLGATKGLFPPCARALNLSHKRGNPNSPEVWLEGEVRVPRKLACHAVRGGSLRVWGCFWFVRAPFWKGCAPPNAHTCGFTPGTSLAPLSPFPPALRAPTL